MAKKVTRKGSQVAPPTKGQVVKKHVQTKAKNDISGFVDFIRTQGIVGLAIGFIIGTQSRLLIDQMNNSFINPLLGLVVGSPEGLTGKTFFVEIGGRSATFGWGAFVYSLINFFVVAVVIYFVFRWLRLDKLDKPKD